MNQFRWTSEKLKIKFARIGTTDKLIKKTKTIVRLKLHLAPVYSGAYLKTCGHTYFGWRDLSL